MIASFMNTVKFLGLIVPKILFLNFHKIFKFKVVRFSRLTISLFIPGPIENPNCYATLAKSWPFIFRKHWAKAKPLTGQLFLLNSLHRGLVYYEILLVATSKDNF